MGTLFEKKKYIRQMILGRVKKNAFIDSFICCIGTEEERLDTDL